MSSSEAVYLRRSDSGIAIVVLNQVAKRNAISAAMMDRLTDILTPLDADDEVRVVVLRGEGEHFSAGGDLDQKVPGADTAEGRRALLRRYHRAIRAIRGIGKPVIGMADGYVVGGALSLLLACDLVCVSDRVTVIPAFCSLGIVPELGLMKLLPDLVGDKLAKEILFLNRRLDATELQRLGLANRVFPATELASRTEELARELSAVPALAVQITKGIMNAATDGGLEAVLQAESTASPLCSTTAGFSESAGRFAR